MSNPNQLFLLADHIKLSLLERQRAQTLKIEDDAQDGEISRSLEQFSEGLAALREKKTRFESVGNEQGALDIADALPALQQQLDDLTSQFNGFSNPSTNATVTHANNPSLAEDFAHASSTASAHRSSNLKPNPARDSSPSAHIPSKSVRFRDQPSRDPDLEAQLFGAYRDDPSPSPGYNDEAADMTNEQIHTYHSSILAEQDEHLDRLGESIGRQRELSMQIGDELDAQVEMLDETDHMVTRHQSRLDRAKNHLSRVARSTSENKQMATILALIIILVLLIAITK